MNVSSATNATLYTAALTNQPAPVSRNKEAHRGAGEGEGPKPPAANEPSGKDGHLDVVT
jgi:hypothetical protein